MGQDETSHQISPRQANDIIIRVVSCLLHPLAVAMLAMTVCLVLFVAHGDLEAKSQSSSFI
jgi:hypothetical protein